MFVDVSANASLLATPTGFLTSLNRQDFWVDALLIYVNVYIFATNTALLAAMRSDFVEHL